MVVVRDIDDPLDLHRRRGPSTSSASRPGGITRRRMGAVAIMATQCGRFGGGSKGQRPLSVKGPSRRQAQTLGVTVLTPPLVLPSAVATGRTGTIDFSPVFSPAKRRAVARLRCFLLARCPVLSRPPRIVAGTGTSHVRRCAGSLGRATDVLWACPRPRTVPGRRVRPRGRDPHASTLWAQVTIVRSLSR